MASAAPADLAITPRNLRFGRDEVRGRWWLGGDVVATAWHNSLSASFPAGEAFFIETVRRFRDQVPAELAAQIDQFVKQESHHTREHVAFNRQVTGAGYDIAAIDKRITKAVRDVLSVEASVASRTSFGGTAPANVRAAITAARKAL